MELLIAMFDYIPTYDQVEFIEEGTELLIEEEYPEEPDWVLCKIAGTEDRGWFPIAIIDKNKSKITLKEMFSPDELEIYKGECLIKISEECGKYYAMNSRNEKGWIPKVLVKSTELKKNDNKN